jgi:hypothetical protein
MLSKPTAMPSESMPAMPFFSRQVACSTRGCGGGGGGGSGGSGGGGGDDDGGRVAAAAAAAAAAGRGVCAAV